MKKNLLLFFIIIFSLNVFSQAPAIQWNNTIGGSSFEEFYAVQQTVDGGYILGGMSFSNISGDKTENSMGSSDIWLVKINATGTIQWQNTIGGSEGENLFALDQTTDGGYILGGISNSNISGDKTENNMGTTATNDYWLVKTDATGNIQWQNTIGGSAADGITSLQQTSDGGYILGGYSYSNISGDKTENNLSGSTGSRDFWIVKTDSVGNIQWQNTIGGALDDNLRSISQTPDGGYIIGGYSNSNISGDKTENSNGSYDYWLVKIDATGNILWQNTIGGSNSDNLNSVEQTADGGYILAGSSSSNASGDKTENSMGGYDYWIVKTNSTGTILWQNTIGGSLDDQMPSACQAADGGYLLGGYSFSSISGDKTENNIGSASTSDYWIVKTDATGNITWQNTIGGSNQDKPYSIQQTADAGYILGGLSNSNISGDKTENSIGAQDYWIIKVAPGVSGVLLPVELLSFEGAANGNVIDLKWTTASEINNDYFTVERSRDAQQFEQVGIVNGAGNSSQALNYFFADTYPVKGLSYYRLMQTDFDGTYSYSNTIAVNFGSDEVNIFFNPAASQLTIISGAFVINGIEIYSSVGEKIFSQLLKANSQQQITIDVSYFPSGIYFITVTDQAGNKVTKKVVKM